MKDELHPVLPDESLVGSEMHAVRPVYADVCAVSVPPRARIGAQTHMSKEFTFNELGASLILDDSRAPPLCSLCSVCADRPPWRALTSARRVP